MTTLRVLVFNPPLLPKSMAHWGLFLPYREGRADGILFQVQKRGYSRSQTMFSQRGFNYRISKSDLLANIPIPEIRVRPVKLNHSCHEVTQNRPFHLLRRNCQLWVFEVIKHLARSEGLDNEEIILAHITTLGFKPMGYQGNIQEGSL